MINLSDFVLSMYPPDHAVGDSVKIAQDLENLSIKELTALVGVDEPTLLEKRAYAMVQKSSMYEDDSKSWLEQFEGSPLAQAAIALCEQELEQRAKHLQKRIERRRKDDYEDEWTERDQLCLQKKRLELALHKYKVGGQGAPTLSKPTAKPAAPTAPAPLAGTPQTAVPTTANGAMSKQAVSDKLKKFATGKA